jgi:iron complex outermembrane receptor protein
MFVMRRAALVLGLIGAGSAARAQTETEATFEPPRLLHAPSVPYPRDALVAGVEGVVRLELELDVEGRVRTATVVEPVHPALDRAARDAARQLRFEPARENGAPVPVRVDYAFRFRVPGESSSEPAEPPRVETATTPKLPEPPTPEPEVPFNVVVLGERPPRSASDWTLQLGYQSTAPPPGTTGADLLRKAPGVYISQHSGQGKGHQIFLRGFDAVHGQDVEVHAGGIPVNDVSNIHGQGYVDLHFLIPEVVKSLRVLEGPFDPRQGDFAVAGSLDFDLGLTRRGVTGRVSAGSFGLVRGLAAWGPEGQPDETFVAAELARGSGFGPSRAWNRATAIGQAVVELGAAARLRLLASTYAGRFDSAGVVREDDVESGRIGFFETYEPRQGGFSGRHQALLELRHDSGFRLSTYLVRRELTLRHNFTGTLVYEEGDRIRQVNDAVVFGARADIGKVLFDGRLRVDVGVDARHDEVEQTQDRLRQLDDEPHTREADNRLGITDVGLFIDANLQVVEQLWLRGGVRAEALFFRIDERAEGSGTPREASGFNPAPKVTLDYRPARRLRLFASYGHGFRSPQAVSLGAGESAPFVVVRAGELGGHWLGGRRLRATLAGFVTHVEEDLLFDHATGQTLFSGPTLRGGVAGVLEARPWDWLHGALSSTYTRATKPDTGDTVPFVPELVVRLDVEAAWSEVARIGRAPLGLFASLGATGLSPRPLPFSETGTGAFIVEAGAGAEWGPVALSLEAFNLFDSTWRDAEFVYASDFSNVSGSRVPARHSTAGRPLTLQATLSITL